MSVRDDVPTGVATAPTAIGSAPHVRRSPTGRLLDTPELRLGDLVIQPPPLHVTDSLGKALRAFATSGLPVLPVVEGDALLGVMSEIDVHDWIADQLGHLGYVEEEAAREAMVMHIMREYPGSAYAEEPLSAVLPRFERQGLAALPVLDSLNRYHGMVPRARVLEALTHGLRPKRVGGMATPFGLFLTTGHQRAGVGSLGLFATGIVVVALNHALMMGVLAASQALHQPLSAPLAAVLVLALFLLLLRLSPLAGLHAAEHQVVHAIEQGEKLGPQTVAAMPREHPRCGTNLLGLLFGAQLLLPLVGRAPLWLLPAGIVLWLTWRRVGAWLQRYVTTKPASPRHVRTALATGNALLRRYAERPAYKAGRWERIWNLGVCQIVAGTAFALLTLELVRRVSPLVAGISP